MATTRKRKTSKRGAAPSRKRTTKRAAGGARRKTGKKTGKAGSKKAGAGRKTGRRYGTQASKKVERSMREMKRGELRSGSTGKPVRNRKQAIAIGLSEARREGGKVPPAPRRRSKSSRSRAS